MRYFLLLSDIKTIDKDIKIVIIKHRDEDALYEKVVEAEKNNDSAMINGRYGGHHFEIKKQPEGQQYCEGAS